MALTIGTNCGFVVTAPTADPSAPTGVQVDYYSHAGRFTSPADEATITQMGWWCGNATEAANFQVGVYSHDLDNDRPLTLLASSGDTAKGTTAGWKTATVDYKVDPSTVYWLAAQVDNVTSDTYLDAADAVGESGHLKTSQGALPSSWGASSASGARLLAIYAVYTVPQGGRRGSQVRRFVLGLIREFIDWIRWLFGAWCFT